MVIQCEQQKSTPNMKKRLNVKMKFAHKRVSLFPHSFILSSESFITVFSISLIKS